MIIQVVLILMLVLVMAYALTQRRFALHISAAILFTGLFGVALVVTPDIANSVAHYAGVGRGADLIFYIFIVLTLAVVLNIHLRLRSDKEALTELARRLAILSAKKPGDPT